MASDRLNKLKDDFDHKLVSQIETKIDKLIEVGFIGKVKYPTWIENIIPIKKKQANPRLCGF